MNLGPLLIPVLLIAPKADGGPATSPAAEAREEAAPASGALCSQAFHLVEVEANTMANLKKAIGLYDECLKDGGLDTKTRVAALIDKSRAYLRLGDLHTTKSAKLAAYENGKAAATEAKRLAPNDAEARFWEVANLASIGQTRGVMNSLFMVGDVKEGLEEVLRKDPNHGYARETLGKVYHALPGIVGGDDKKAEALWLENLRKNPGFTSTMLVLGRFYVEKGRKDEARKMFQRVLDTKNPTLPNDTRKFDLAAAKQELAKLEGK